MPNSTLSDATKFGMSVTVAVVLTSLVAVTGAQATEVRPNQGDTVQHAEKKGPFKPTGKGWGETDPTGWSGGQSSRSSSNGIFYHGGPVMRGTVNIYYIWYGAWDFSHDNTNTILNNFAHSIGGTPYFNINTTYFDSTKTAVSGLVGFPTFTSDSGSQGSSLSDAAVQNVVANALTHNALPTDPNGVYFVLTSKEVTETSGFCTQYCAWHTNGMINGKDIKYGFVGNPARCPSACSAQNITPNSNLAADGMANLIAHELAEATTDPDLNAWFDNSGNENADKCAWQFGATSRLPNGAQFNVKFGNMNWLLQQNWINTNRGYCTLSR